MTMNDRGIGIYVDRQPPLYSDFGLGKNLV